MAIAELTQGLEPPLGRNYVAALAQDRFDQPAALALLTSAAALYEGTDPRRVWALVEIGEIHLSRGEANGGNLVLSEALDAARRAGELVAEGYAEIGLARVRRHGAIVTAPRAPRSG